MTLLHLVEDNAVLRRQLGDELAVRGYTVVGHSDATQAIAALLQAPPDVILLDLGLPDIDGSTLLSVIRATSQAIPVIVVTARTDNDEIVRLLDLGADDYVTKPFDVTQLEARIRAVLRRAGPAADTTGGAPIDVGPLRIDLGRRIVTLDARRINLRPLEFELLQMLVLADGHPLSGDVISRTIWGTTGPEAAARLDVHLSTLRAHLGETAKNPRLLHRERGVGLSLAVLEE